MDSLTAKLTELNKQPFHHREEKAKILAEMDKRMKVKAQTELSIFINSEIEKAIEKGSTVSSKAIQEKAASMDIHGDMAPYINEVMELRRHF